MEEEAEISLEDLGKTYQRIFSTQSSGVLPTNQYSDPADEQETSSELVWTDGDETSVGDLIPVTAEGILEAILFVGHPKNHPITASALAGLMRGVSADDIAALVDRLNERYERCRQSIRIVGSDHGYRLSLIPELNEIKVVFSAKVQTVRLNQQAIDCLALIAYAPGITMEEIEQKWQRSAGSVVRMLIRRNLVELKFEGKGKSALRKHYPTDRFLTLVGIDSLEDLPIAWE